MASQIEDYAIIGDTHTAALVSRHGSIDWLCLPRFDSDACFAALLGEPTNGRWQITPADAVRATRRRYRPGTLILETELETANGTIRLIDFMPPRENIPHLFRIVEGVHGTVAVTLQLVLRFDYGHVVPWVRKIDGRLLAVVGPDAVTFTSTVPTRGEDLTTRADFTVSEGEQAAFTLEWHPSHRNSPSPRDPQRALDDTEAWWRSWSSRCSYKGRWRDAVVRSSITLKALTYGPSGGIVAAPTTSLPEKIGGVRNWDYRYCWVRDATYTLSALVIGGYKEEAAAWRNWLLRAVGGDPDKLQILYGLRGERRIQEIELPWLAGFEASKPVRIGNAAVAQTQLDVYGELMDAMYLAERAGIPPSDDAWHVQMALLGSLERRWRDPDAGIWEIRGPLRHFTHSKVMAWVAFDRAIRSVEEFGVDGPVEEWRRTRQTIHDLVCRDGFDAARNCFTQYFGSDEVDGSLLLLPLVGFIPATDPRMLGTVAAIEHDLIDHGFVRRYRPRRHLDGLPGGEGVFLACSFWLVANLALQGRHGEAERLFERLLSVANDVGLLAEEYDPGERRQLGNFPQAFSHVMLINAARHLTPGSSDALLRHEL